jgi:hypothetical protein
MTYIRLAGSHVSKMTHIKLTGSHVLEMTYGLENGDVMEPNFHFIICVGMELCISVC